MTVFRSEILRLSSSLKIEPLSARHAVELFSCVEANRSWLRRWLSWLDTTTSLDDINAFIAGEVQKREAEGAATYAIFSHEQLCGCAGFRTLDKAQGVGELGYWLAQDHTGKGLVYQIATTLIEQGFQEYGLQRIEIHCATGNGPSRRVAESLGASLSHIQENAGLLYGHSVDHAVYFLNNDGVTVPGS